MNNNYLVIMAGGIGSRFWPMSTAQKPKQFLDVLNIGHTLIQQTVDRFSGICPSENIFVVTSAAYKSIINEQLPQLDDSQILLEPCMRNTAPCIAYASWKIKKRNPQANIIVAPSDHLITDTEGFKSVINEGLAFTATNEALLTLGMEPHKAETGYGYIQTGEQQTQSRYKVAAFKEKPDLPTAKTYLSTGGYYWNSGIFLWHVNSIEQAIRSYIPELAKTFDTINNDLDTAQEQEAINTHFPQCPNISVDYGIMENAQNIYVRTASFGWSDLGTWGSLHELSDKDECQNVIKGNVKTFETTNTVVRSETDKKVIVQGLDNFIVVDTPDALLVCNKSEEQRIKEFQK